MAFANDDIDAVTDKGNAELKSAGTSLSAAELQVLILVDGDATVAQITRRAANLKPADVNEILRKLYSARLITIANEPGSDGLASGFSTVSVPAGFFSSITEQTKAEAEQGVEREGPGELIEDGGLVEVAGAQEERAREHAQGGQQLREGAPAEPARGVHREPDDRPSGQSGGEPHRDGRLAQ